MTKEDLSVSQHLDSLPNSHKASYFYSKEEEEWSLCFRIVNRLNNSLWLHFYITFFYFSLIEINLNVFTQIANLTFSSSFAAAGAYFSAVFLAL